MSKTNTDLSKASSPAITPSSHFSPTMFVEGAAPSASGTPPGLSDSKLADPMSEALGRLKACENALRHCEAQVVNFRNTYLTPVGRIWAYRQEYWPRKDELEAQFKQLVKERGAAFQAHQAAMRSYAQLKTESEHGRRM